MSSPRRLWIMLLLASSGAAWAADAPTFKEITTAFGAAEHAKVIELAAAFPAASADGPKVHYLAGESRLVLGQWVEAETEFRAVLAARPKAVPASVGLGRALSALGKHEEAHSVLRAAVLADAKDVSALRSLGESLLAAGVSEEGRTRLDEAAKLAPNDPLTARARVEAYLRAAEADQAQAVAAKLETALPKHPMGPFLTALVADKGGDAEAAIAAYEKALERDDTFLDAHKNLAILCHARSNTYSDAVRVKKAFAHYERYFALGGADERLKAMYATLKQFASQLPGGGR